MEGVDFLLRYNSEFGHEVYKNGDLLMVHAQESVNPGDLAVVRWPGGETHIRRVFQVGNNRVYVSEDNTDLAPVLENNMPFTVIGKVIGVKYAMEG